MGEVAADTVNEIEETRERLGEELDELGRRIPSPPDFLQTKPAKIGIGAGAGTLVALLLARKVRRKRRLRAATEVFEETVSAPAESVLPRRKPRLRKTRLLLGGASLGLNAYQYKQLQAVKNGNGQHSDTGSYAA